MKVECYVEQSTRRIGKAMRGIGLWTNCALEAADLTNSTLFRFGLAMSLTYCLTAAQSSR